MTNLELPTEMHCKSCEQRVQRALHGLDGVQSVTTDLKRQRVAIEFDDKRVDESDVRVALAKAESHGITDG